MNYDISSLRDAFRYQTRRERRGIINLILFQKYHVLSLIGSGGSSNVYLAEHVKLKTYRAIKRISKANLIRSSFLQEASLLKNLRHPGIPIIYDMEEDESYYYLIEEYIQGESLFAYAQNHDNISQDTIIAYGIQLCSILKYLHGLKPSPVLYLDLKPEHIILCGNQIKIIDFGISSMADEAGNVCQGCGTRGFAAPEQYLGTNLSAQTDVYGIGAVLYYLLTKDILQISAETSFHFPKYCSKNFRHIIKKAAAGQKEQRYESVFQLEQELQKELMYRKERQKTEHLLKKIIVTGSQSRVGATHVSISLVSWLNRKGLNACYEEKNGNHILGQLARYKEGFCEQGGIFCYGSFQGLPGNVREKEPLYYENSILVQDYGHNLTEILESQNPDLLILVMGARAWEAEQAVKCYEMLSGEDNLIIVCNYNDRQLSKDYAKIFQKNVFCFPLDEDPFSVSREKDRLFGKLWKEGSD